MKDGKSAFKTKQCEVSLQETEPEGFVNIQQKFKGDMASLHEIQDELLITTFVALFKRYENTKFYHNSVISYQARNAVTYLIDDQENQVHKGIEIKGLAISYYQKLLGEENNEVVSLSV
ncbi:hypothetical protein YC2023_089458 [Brassica napus]